MEPQPAPGSAFADLVRWMIAADGKHGARKRVAERLGIHPTDVPKILAGRRIIGAEVAERAARRIGLDPGYFSRGGDPSRWFGAPLHRFDAPALPGVGLRGLRERAREVQNTILLSKRFGSLPSDIRRAGHELAREFERSSVAAHAQAVLALDPTKDPLAYDRAIFDLALDLVTEVRDPDAPVQDAEALAPLWKAIERGERPSKADLAAAAEPLGRVLTFVLGY